jgi:hypothetical protein
MRRFLEPVGDPTQQDIAAQAFGWRRLIETPPFVAQTFDRKALIPADVIPLQSASAVKSPERWQATPS